MPATRAAYRTTEVICEHCGTRFKAYRASAKYCGGARKQRAKRERGFRTAVKEVRELVRTTVAGADPRGPASEAELQEQLHQAELERDIREKACKAVIQVLGKPGPK